ASVLAEESAEDAARLAAADATENSGNRIATDHAAGHAAFDPTDDSRVRYLLRFDRGEGRHRLNHRNRIRDHDWCDFLLSRNDLRPLRNRLRLCRLRGRRRWRWRRLGERVRR